MTSKVSSNLNNSMLLHSTRLASGLQEQDSELKLFSHFCNTDLLDCTEWWNTIWSRWDADPLPQRSKGRIWACLSQDARQDTHYGQQPTQQSLDAHQSWQAAFQDTWSALHATANEIIWGQTNICTEQLCLSPYLEIIHTCIYLPWNHFKQSFPTSWRVLPKP